MHPAAMKIPDYPTPVSQQAGAGEREWVRIMKGGLYTKADDRPVDVLAISAMLRRRIACKARHEYAAADEIATQLQNMGIWFDIPSYSPAGSVS